MSAKRNWSNFAVILLTILVVITIWQMFYAPSRTIPDIPQYSKSAYSLYTNYTISYTYPLNTLDHDDYNRLIDLNFTFDILPPACCNESAFVLIMVHSSPENFEKRRTIRETWGRYNSNNNRDKVRLLFVLGAVKNSTLERKLGEENENFGDFLRGSFVDAYKNLTYKHVMLFKYAVYHCPEAKYIMKTDDDVFVNTPLMWNFLIKNLSPFGASDLLFCAPREHSRVLRSYRSKWRVSFREYPAKNYPTYCPGWFLLYSQNVVFDLYKMAQKSPYFWIDDIHLTGTLFRELNMIHADAEPYMITQNELEQVERGANVTRPFLIGQPNLKIKQIRLLWSLVETINPNVPPTIVRL